jgi:hypothetical protein
MSNDDDRARQRIVDGTAWNELLDRLRDAGKIVQSGPDDPLTRAEGYRYLSRLARAGLEAFVEHADPLAPVLRRPVHETIKMGADNPDNHYFHASISGAYTYVVRGRRNTVHYLQFATLVGHYGQSRGMPPAGVIDATELVLEPDGSFELVLAQERPAGAKNWIKTTPDTGSFMVRQSRLDPKTETLAELTLVRTSGPAEHDQALTPKKLDEGLHSTGMLVFGASMMFAMWADGFKDKHLNRLPRFDQALSNAMGGVPDIAYYHSYWKLAEGEALVIDATPPRCDHWNFQLENHWMESLDYHLHTIHTNSKLAVMRTDGSVRVVVAHRDPGVPNWIRTAGHSFGAMCWRWVKPESMDGAPEPATRVVKLESVKGLP